MLMTRPWEARSSGSAAAVVRQVPSRLTSSTRRASGPGRSPALWGRPMPAQLMSASSPPRRWTPAATALSTEAWSVTLQAITSSESLRSRPTTAAPRSRSALAVAAPMPLAAPVMITRLLTGRTVSTPCRVGQQTVDCLDSMYRGTHGNRLQSRDSCSRQRPERPRPPRHQGQRRRSRAGDLRDGGEAARGKAAERDLRRRPRQGRRHFPPDLLLLLPLPRRRRADDDRTDGPG